MDFNNILNQVLNVAKETFNDTKNGNSTQDKITKVGGGAAALGLLSMLLGRKGGAGLAKLGSLAALLTKLIKNTKHRISLHKRR